MIVKHEVVKFERLWITLPNVSGVELSMPKRGSIIEAYVPDTYTETQLRTFALEQGALGNGVISAEKVAALPPMYVTSVYEMVRYGKDPLPGIFRFKAGPAISTSLHALPGLMLMSRVLLAIYRKLANSIEPDKMAEADRILRLLTHIDYGLWTVLKKYPGVDVTSIPLVFSAQTITTTAGDVSEETYVVYLDSDKLDEYIDDGGTAEEAVNWWVDNKTQPPALS